VPKTPNEHDSATIRNPKPGIVAWLRDNRVIAVAESTGCTILTTGFPKSPGKIANNQIFCPVTAQFPDLRQIDWVIDINLFSDPGDTERPVCLAGAYNKKISGNIVGFTIVGMTAVPSGTTLFAEVIAIGPP